MKINRKIAAVATVAALGTLALSAGPAFAAVGHGSGNPRDFQPSFTIQSKSAVTFKVGRRGLPANEQFVFTNTVRPFGKVAWQKAWAGGPAVTLKGGVQWYAMVVGRYVPKHPVHKAPIHKK